MGLKRGLAIVVLLAVGSVVGTTIGYGLYHRSDLYRHKVEHRLSEFFGLPVEIGRIEPHTFTSRQLTQIRIWLPDRRAQVLDCPSAIWDSRGAEADNGAAIHIHDAVLLLGSDNWLKDDYMRVLRASLAHNFAQLNIREVVFHGGRIEWMRRDLHLSMERLEGRVNFADDGTGTARFVAQSLNGLPMSEPMQIAARLAPREDEFLQEVTLTVPTLPLSSLGLDRVLGAPVTQGSFAGRITVRPSPSGDLVELKGEARHIRLEEFTRRLAGGPITGQVDLSISEARVRGRQLEMLGFSGQVRKLGLNTIAPNLGIPLIGGYLHLLIDKGMIEGDSIRSLHASGEWTGASLDTLMQSLLGRGGIRGQLKVDIRSLTIEKGELASGDVDIIATPPPRGSGTIDRDLLLEVLAKQMGLTLPSELLPEQIEFVQLGARLVIDPRRVRVLSIEGPAGPAVITARIFGTLVPILGNVDERFELKPLMDRLKGPLAQLKSVVKERLHTPTGSRPAASHPARPVTSLPSR